MLGRLSCLILGYSLKSSGCIRSRCYFKKSDSGSFSKAVSGDQESHLANTRIEDTDRVPDTAEVRGILNQRLSNATLFFSSPLNNMNLFLGL